MRPSWELAAVAACLIVPPVIRWWFYLQASPSVDTPKKKQKEPTSDKEEHGARMNLCRRYEDRTVFSDADRRPLPCLVVTGFLGSGKVNSITTSD